MSYTNREIEILDLLREGYGNKEIGHHLGLSRQTIKNHLSRIYYKLGVENRIQAAQEAQRIGLLVSDTVPYQAENEQIFSLAVRFHEYRTKYLVMYGERVEMPVLGTEWKGTPRSYRIMLIFLFGRLMKPEEVEQDDLYALVN